MLKLISEFLNIIPCENIKQLSPENVPNPDLVEKLDGAATAGLEFTQSSLYMLWDKRIQY